VKLVFFGMFQKVQVSTSKMNVADTRLEGSSIQNPSSPKHIITIGAGNIRKMKRNNLLMDCTAKPIGGGQPKRAKIARL
jgi:hypothetical protein